MHVCSSVIHIHNEVRQYDSTWQHSTKHLTETEVRSYNMFKHDRKIQTHKSELATMEYHHLPLNFCKTRFILTTDGQISQYLVALNVSVSSDFSCEHKVSVRKPDPFQNSAYPLLQQVVTTSGRATSNWEQDVKLPLETLFYSASRDMLKGCNPGRHLHIRVLAEELPNMQLYKRFRLTDTA